MSRSQFAADFDVERKLNSLVSISAYIPTNSYSAGLLGTERSGHGAVIRDDDLIATVGYLITEAESVWIEVGGSGPVPAYIVGNDYESGVALLKPVTPIGLPRLELGRAADLAVGDPVLVAGRGGPGQVLESRVVDKREFAGRWEYVLDEAIYTAPVYPDWAGAALIGRDGRLYGVGCLLIQDMKSKDLSSGSNMFIPIDAITPVIDEIVGHGARKQGPRPWLGILLQEEEARLVVTGIFHRCPADVAGVKPGDAIVALAGRTVTGLAAFYRGVWHTGRAGAEIPLTVERDETRLDLVIRSGDRESAFRRGPVN